MNVWCCIIYTVNRVSPVTSVSNKFSTIVSKSLHYKMRLLKFDIFFNFQTQKSCLSSRIVFYDILLCYSHRNNRYLLFLWLQYKQECLIRYKNDPSYIGEVIFEIVLKVRGRRSVVEGLNVPSRSTRGCSFIMFTNIEIIVDLFFTVRAFSDTKSIEHQLLYIVCHQCTL